MMNTHILAQEFEYLEPKTVEEALRLLRTYGERARIIAGGTDLLVRMKMDMVHPEVLINIARVPALRYLTEGKGLRIGTLTPFQELEKSRVIQAKYTALFEAASWVTSVQIKNMGTLGGNICHASPAADSPPALIVLGGKAKMVSEKGARTVPLDDFFVGPRKTVLGADELLLEIEVPERSKGFGSAFLKIARVTADLAKVNVAAAIEREGEVCRDCRIALGSVAPRPLRCPDAEQILKGKRYSEVLVETASRRASEEIQPITDMRSTAWYRREVSKVLVRDALRRAWERAGD